MKTVRIPFGCILSHTSAIFAICAISGTVEGEFEFLPSIIDRIKNWIFVVQSSPAVCAGTLLVFLVACVCSLFFNAGLSSENSPLFGEIAPFRRLLDAMGPSPQVLFLFVAHHVPFLAHPFYFYLNNFCF